MPTTQDYLNDLLVQKKKLAKCVSTCVECSEDETLNSIVPKVEKVITNTFSWENIKKLVELGVASEFFKVGQQLICKHKKYGTLTWDIIGIDYETIDNYTHSLTLQLHDCVEALQFDDSSSYWPDSAIRQWLNTETESGFLHGMDNDFINVIGSVPKITTRLKGADTNTERFFLLSSDEAHKYNEKVYPYFASNTSIKTLNGEPITWWLRNGSDTSDYIARAIDLNGNVSGYHVISKRGVSPVCCIVG